MGADFSSAFLGEDLLVDLYTPTIDSCNGLLPKEVTNSDGATAHITEGCIFNGNLDPTKNRAACVIDDNDETPQLLLYCDKCSDDGCNVVSAYTNDDTLNLPFKEILDRCPLADNSDTSFEQFCFLRGFNNAFNLPPHLGVKFGTDGFGSSRRRRLEDAAETEETEEDEDANDEDANEALLVARSVCELLKGGYWCDGTAASVAASQFVSQGGCEDRIEKNDYTAMKTLYEEHIDTSCTDYN
tara:strand:+ start:510 stop:1235 length:726 start_codon:yes stop_codon:yes gene_type:complete